MKIKFISYYFTDVATTMVSTSPTVVVGLPVNRRGGGGGGGHGHSGGHASEVHGNSDHDTLPHTQGGGAIPIYGSGGTINHDHYNNRHGTRSGAVLNNICFYHYFILFISFVTGVFLS